MQKIMGFILRDNDNEVLEDQSPGKGTYMGLIPAMMEARKILKETNNIKQINIYSLKQGQRILDMQLTPETVDIQFELMNIK